MPCPSRQPRTPSLPNSRSQALRPTAAMSLLPLPGTAGTALRGPRWPPPRGLAVWCLRQTARRMPRRNRLPLEPLEPLGPWRPGGTGNGRLTGPASYLTRCRRVLLEPGFRSRSVTGCHLAPARSGSGRRQVPRRAPQGQRCKRIRAPRSQAPPSGRGIGRQSRRLHHPSPDPSRAEPRNQLPSCPPGRPHVPGQSLPGQSLPGQSHPGQSHPGQSLPSQHLPGQHRPGSMPHPYRHLAGNCGHPMPARRGRKPTSPLTPPGRCHARTRQMPWPHGACAPVPGHFQLLMKET
jgi:hypothetical protein